MTKDSQICNKRASEKMTGLANILIRDSYFISIILLEIEIAYSSKKTVCVEQFCGYQIFKDRLREEVVLFYTCFSSYKNKNRDFLQKCITLDILIRNLEKHDNKILQAGEKVDGLRKKKFPFQARYVSVRIHSRKIN